MRPANYLKDFLILLVAGMIVVAALYGASAFGKRSHAAEACQEDEAWIAVSVGTPNSFEDSHGVTRACVNVEDI